MKNLLNAPVLECFAHYAEHHLPPMFSKNATEKKKPCANFCGVSEKTIQRWIVGGAKPQGLELIKLVFFLDAFGYTVSEMTEIRANKVSYALAQLLAFNIFSVEEAMSLMDYVHSHAVYRAALGLNIPVDLRQEMLLAYYEDKKNLLESKKKDFLMSIGKIGGEQVIRSVSDITQPSVSCEAETINSNVDTSINGMTIDLIANLVKAITPILDVMVRNSSREQRDALRHALGADGMGKLSKASSRLVSEKAREII